MIYPAGNRYEVLLQNKYWLGEIIEDLSLDETLDHIAYRASFRAVPPHGDQFTSLPDIKAGQEISILGTPFDQPGSMQPLLTKGVVWEVEIENPSRRHWSVVVYDRTIYLAKSEDEYFLPAGDTATTRLKRYAADWGVPLASNLVDTKVKLQKAIRRAKPIWDLIQADLIETVEKGGAMYRPRMNREGQLELYELGTNTPVWMLEFERNLLDTRQRQSLEGAITQVKVLGHASKNKRSPVLAVVKGQVEQYGTLQKVVSDSKATTTAEAAKLAGLMLSGVQESVDVRAIDINTIRAGDQVYLEGWPGLIAIGVKHRLGNPGDMSLQLAPVDYVRRRYFVRQSF